MTNKDNLAFWKSRLETAIRYREPYLRDWRYFEGMYDDNLWGTNSWFTRVRRTAPNDANFIPQINELEPILMNTLPKINFNYPVFEVEFGMAGATSDQMILAMIYEMIAVKLYEMLDMFETNEDIALDALLLGGGVHKTGFSYDVETANYHSIEGTANDPEIKNEMVMSGYVSPKNLLWDYRFDRWKQKRWMAEEIVKPVDEVRDSDLYENTKNIQGDVATKDNFPDLSRRDRKDYDMVRIVEIHDLANGKIHTLAPNHDKWLRYNDDDYGFEVYDVLEFTPTRPRRMWGKSLAQSIEEHILSLSKNLFYMDADAENNAILKLLVDSGLINKTGLQALESHKNRALVPVDGLSNHASSPVQEVRVSPKTFNFASLINVRQRVIREITGSTMQERGAHEPGVETLGEAAMIMESSEVRNKYRALKFSVFIQKIMTKMLRIATNHIPPERLADMIGVPPEKAFIIQPFDRMKLSVKFGSTAMEARGIQLNKILTLSKALPVGQIINPMEFAKRLMDALGFGLRDQLLLMTPQSQTTTPPQSGASGGEAPVLEGSGAQSSGEAEDMMGNLSRSPF